MEFSRYQFFTHGNEVIAVSSYAGRAVRGVAKCDPRDEFSLENGKKLAAARCNLKIAEKRQRRAEGKINEATRLCKEADQHFNKMAQYLSDSHTAAIHAKRELNELISKM